jgi:hypothetical protein
LPTLRTTSSYVSGWPTLTDSGATASMVNVGAAFAGIAGPAGTVVTRRSCAIGLAASGAGGGSEGEGDGGAGTTTVGTSTPSGFGSGSGCFAAGNACGSGGLTVTGGMTGAGSGSDADAGRTPSGPAITGCVIRVRPSVCVPGWLGFVPDDGSWPHEVGVVCPVGRTYVAGNIPAGGGATFDG